MSVEKRRLGKIRLSDGVVDLLSQNEQVMYEFASRFPIIPLRTEHRYDMRNFEIIALSPLFDEIGVGEETPVYDVRVDANDTGSEAKIKNIVVTRGA